MTTFYSNHYSGATSATGHFTTRLTYPAFISAGEKHGRMRKSAARCLIPSGADLGSGDIIRLLDLKSGARVWDLRFSMDADFGATSTFDIGLYKKGTADDGVAVDADLFTTAVDWAGAITRVDYFKESTTLTDMDRGLPLYALIAAGATYTSDPMETWTLALTTTQDISATAAAVNLLVEVDFTAGD